MYPNISVHGIVTDFIIKVNFFPNARGCMVCFFGSTIGNMDISNASHFLNALKCNMNTGDELLLGLDMVKSKIILEKAYNDSKQVTANFNKNILSVVNSIVGTDFDTDRFEHVAFFNEEESRIEMHLRARESMRISSPLLNSKIEIKKGETIHTENSYKYTKDHIEGFAASSGFNVKNIFSDDNKWFSLVQFVK